MHDNRPYRRFPCAACGVEVITQEACQIYCSARCKIAVAARRFLLRRAGPVRRFPCPACGAAVATRDRRRAYCSRRCQRKARRDRYYRLHRDVVIARTLGAYRARKQREAAA